MDMMLNTANSIDVALPTPIDDEYWSLPGLGSDRMPQQPEGKPSKVAAMVSMLRLSQILAFATRTLVSVSTFWHRCTGNNLTHFSQYPTNKPKRADSTWEQRIVSELDSALNNWLDTLPSHRTSPCLCNSGISCRVLMRTSVVYQCAGILTGKTPFI